MDRLASVIFTGCFLVNRVIAFPTVSCGGDFCIGAIVAVITDIVKSHSFKIFFLTNNTYIIGSRKKLLGMAFLLGSCRVSGNTIRFGAADIGGMYYAFANTFSELANEASADYTFEVRTTAGSSNLPVCLLPSSRPEILTISKWPKNWKMARLMPFSALLD